MALPTKLYPDVDKSGQGFVFKTRDPAAEMQYTAQTLEEIMSTTGPWANAETAIGTVLTSRFHDSEDALYNGTSGVLTRWNTIRQQVESVIFPSGTADTAYSQYLAGMSAAFGGGHTNVSYLSGLANQDRRFQAYETSIKAAQTLMGLTYGAVSNMPLVVPVESQLVADACSSAIETNYLAEIRAQQLRQQNAAGSIFSNVAPSQGTNPTPIDETIMFASINAQGASMQTY